MIGEDDGRVLSDLRVIDLTQMLAGPYATMLLADLGADVIKVEPPNGDLIRQNLPHLRDDEAYGGYFHSVNRNKRSISLDLKTDEGKRILKDLVSDADILVENYRAGTMDRLGLSYENLSNVNPSLVYASIRGFGDPRTGESPYSQRPAFDLVAQAMGGIMSITGTEESGPVKVGPGVGDIFPAVLSVVGILGALHRRERTGEGEYVDVGMVDAVLSLCERIVHQYSFTGEIPQPQGNSHPILFPFDRFEAQDGYLVIAAVSDKQWVALCEHMDRQELASRYESQVARHENADELRAEINSWTKRHTKQELFDELRDTVPCAPVQDAGEIFEDEHFRAREMLPTVEHADTGTDVQIAGEPIKFLESADTDYRRAPFLGEDTRDVLTETGLTEEEVEALLEESVVRTWDRSENQ